MKAPESLTVACVESGNYQGRGAEYVDKLRSMVARYLTLPHRFVCVRPEVEGLKGWWNKVELFRPGRFQGRVLYLDLDTVITGPLDALAAHPGIIHLVRWGWAKHVYGSGCMVWDAGQHADVFTRYSADVPKKFEGDQNWIQSVSRWDALPFPLVCSAKYHCKNGPPPGAAVACFHGPKKPHNSNQQWVRDNWR